MAQEILSTSRNTVSIEESTPAVHLHKQDNRDPLILAYAYICEAMQIAHNTVNTQAKQLSTNAAAQNDMINREAQLHFDELKMQTVRHEVDQHYGSKHYHGHGVGTSYFQTWTRDTWVTEKDVVSNINYKQTQLEALSNKNQTVAALRDYLSDQLNVQKQNAQVLETDINTSVGSSQQSTSQGSSLMTMLVSLSNQITQI